MSAQDFAALDVLAARLLSASAGRRAAADQLTDQCVIAETDAEEARKLAAQTKAVADLGTELINTARSWQRLADKLEAGARPPLGGLPPGAYRADDLANAYRMCAVGVESALQTAVRALEL